MHLRNLPLAAILLASAAPAVAADSADAAIATVEGADSADIIVVTGQRPEYGVDETSTATRTDTPVKDIPQALTVISESQIEDQDLRSIADVLFFVPGTMPGTGEGNRDQITIRGQNTTADFFVDGIRDDVQYSRDLYNVDRVEVLRGPNAMIFGRGGGGGVVNRVTKRSSLNPYREFAISGDTEGGVRLTADVDQPLANSVGLRVNGMYENGESFRDHVELERYGINPTVGILTGPATRIDLSYEYLDDRRTTDRGVPSLGGRPIEGFDEVFFGDPDLSYADVEAHVGTFMLHHELGEGLMLRNRTLYGDYDKFYQNVFPSRIETNEAGEQEVVLVAYNNRTDRRNLFAQTDLIWENQLAGIDQTLLFGFELGRQESENQRHSASIADNRVPLSNPTVDADVTFIPAPVREAEATIAAIYVQDQIRLSPMLEIVAGLRFDSFRLDYREPESGTELARTDELLSPRLGLIFKPNPQLSLYASYSRSYLPASGDQFSGLDDVSEGLKPERFDNYEIGAKWEPLEGLLATAAIYQLERTNTTAVDPNDPTRVVLTGAQRSRGLELGLERSVSDQWQISAGYALQEAEIVEATERAPAGREVPLVPRHSFSLWNRYDVSDVLGLGLGVIAQSKSYTGISNDVILPGYTRVDAAAFYEISDGIEAQVNVENILGEDYFRSAHSDNNIAPGAPTTARATLRFRM